MDNKHILIPYKVMQPKGNTYRVNMHNEVVRALAAAWKRENRIAYYDPLSDEQRLRFEDIIVRARIDDRDNVVTALEKFKRAESEPKRGYTSADVMALRNKLLSQN